MLLFQTNDWYTFFLILLFGPLPVLWIYTMMIEDKGLVQGMRRLVALSSQNLGRILGLFVLLLLIAFLFFSITDTMLLSFYLDLVNWIIYFDQETMEQLSIVLLTFTTMFVFHLVFTLLLIGLGLLYHTLVEIKEANYLKDKIQSIGTSNKIKGLERESNY